MSLKKILFCTAVLALCAGAAAQTTRDGRNVDLRFYGIYRAYPQTVPPAIKAPKGYRPVYISHYGRHGSRYIIPDSTYTFIKKVLETADADGKLTDEGKALKKHYLTYVFPNATGRAGELTPVGMTQHRDIATRMYRNFPSLFKGKARVIANSTNFERTMLSMLYFCDALHLCNPALDIKADASITDTYYLNPHQASNPLSREFEKNWKNDYNAAWLPEHKKYAESHIDWHPFAGRIFTDTLYASSRWNMFIFDEAIYTVAISMGGMAIPQDNYFRFWNYDELEWMARCNENYKYYVMKGNYPGGLGRAPALCEAMLNDIITRTESDIREGVKARLRFGHDGCIMAMFALMEIPGWEKAEADPDKFWDCWSDEEIPMAANIQMVVFRGRTDDDLILCWLVNEKPMKLQIGEVAPGFYKWSDFRDFYSERVEYGRKHMEESNRILDKLNN